MNRPTRHAPVGVIVVTFAALAVASHAITRVVLSSNSFGFPRPGEPEAVTMLTTSWMGERAPTEQVSILLMFVGSSSCAYSQADQVRYAVAAAAAVLRAEGAQRDVSTAIVGIAIDRSAAQGIVYLEAVGGFDEMVAGGAWAAETAGAILVEVVGEHPSTPQIVVLEREVDDPGANPRLRFKVSGSDEIQRWAAQGSRIPQLVPHLALSSEVDR